MHETTGSRRPSLPRAPGLPLVGNLFGLLGNVQRTLLAAYRDRGPVFSLNVPGKTVIALAGLEANLFLSRATEDQLRNTEVYKAMAVELGTPNLILATDGPLHRRKRRINKIALSREAIAGYIPTIVETARRRALAWRAGERVDVVRTMEELLLEQTGLCMVGRSVRHRVADLLLFEKFLVDVTVLQRVPRIALRLPRYREAKARVHAMIRETIEEHRARAPQVEGADFMDALLRMSDEHGQPLSSDDLTELAILPFLAGGPTMLNTSAFMIHALLSRPGLVERVVSEADAAFAQGMPSPAALKGMTALHGCLMETLRLYPAAPAVMRYVAEPFAHAGHRIEAGQAVMFGTTVTHLLPELFSNPESFDVDRSTSSRNEYRQPGAFAPFAVGAHTCAGAGLAEVQILLTMATLLHTTRMELDPASSVLRRAVGPLPKAREFQVRVTPRHRG